MRAVFANGLATGLVLQLAIGPVFFFIINLALQRTTLDALAGVLAVTIVDYSYIALAIFGVGRLLQNKKVKKVFGGVSSVVLTIFGLIIINGIFGGSPVAVGTASTNVGESFVSTFFLTVSNPMTVVFFTGLFTAKAIEYDFTKKELLVFGLGTGLGTLVFMGMSVILFSLIREAVPVILVQILNLTVACVLLVYGGLRFLKILSD